MIQMATTATNTMIMVVTTSTMQMASTVGTIPTLKIPTIHNTVDLMDTTIMTAHMIHMALVMNGGV